MNWKFDCFYMMINLNAILSNFSLFISNLFVVFFLMMILCLWISRITRTTLSWCFGVFCYKAFSSWQLIHQKQIRIMCVCVWSQFMFVSTFTQNDFTVLCVCMCVCKSFMSLFFFMRLSCFMFSCCLVVVGFISNASFIINYEWNVFCFTWFKVMEFLFCFCLYQVCVPRTCRRNETNRK